MDIPVKKTLTAGQWNLIASGVTSVTVWKEPNKNCNTRYTYRPAGETAPTDRAEGIPIFQEDEERERSIPMVYKGDVYIFAAGTNGAVWVSENLGETHPVRSIVPGSNVWSDIRDEVVKRGQMYVVQKVFRGISVGTEVAPAYFTFLFDLSAVTADYLVLYDIQYSVNKGQGIGTFYGQGGYTGGTPVNISNRNENSLNTAESVITYFNDGATQDFTPGPEGQSYLAGSPGQGNQSQGGSTPGDTIPTEVNKSINRIFQIEQAGGTDIFNLSLRILLAEVKL